MKRIFTLAVITAAAIATGASALPNGLEAERQIKRYAPDANVAGMTDEQIQSILLAIHSGDGASEVSGTVRALANAAQ